MADDSRSCRTYRTSTPSLILHPSQYRPNDIVSPRHSAWAGYQITAPNIPSTLRRGGCDGSPRTLAARWCRCQIRNLAWCGSCSRGF